MFNCLVFRGKITPIKNRKRTDTNKCKLITYFVYLATIRT